MIWLENKSTIGLIQPFLPVGLPSLAVIIGVNGVGKSQLLRAISTGAIGGSLGPNAELPISPSDVFLLTNVDAGPGLAELAVSRGTLLEGIMRTPVRDRDPIVIINEALEQQQVERDTLERTLASKIGKTVEGLDFDWTEFASFLTNKSISRLGSKSGYEFSNILNQANEAGERISSILKRRGEFELPYQQHSLRVLFPEPAYFLTLSAKQFAAAIGWESTNLFAADLVSIFLKYRDRRWRNQVQRQTDEDDGTTVAYTREEFESAFGRPPWELVSEAIIKFGLPYEVIPPSPNIAVHVAFRLRREGVADAIEFTALSSGERVLFRMVLSTFQADEKQLNVRSPKLILLDELDASLHPENVQRWLGAIAESYVGKHEIPCIITTHSPTTVALAPEGSIFEMTADNPRPVSISKQQAIDRLTAGLPMLAIDYSARRQVFAESTIDVKHYSMLHDIMRSRLDLQRTLSFVGTGTVGGCVFVYDMVKNLEHNGNRSIFGIVDWDLKNKPTKFVTVIGEGTHYAKDNVLLDPLLVGCLLLKGDDLILDPPIRYSNIRFAPLSVLQQISNAVVERVRFTATASESLTKSRYWNKSELDIREAYQCRNGHDLEAAIKAAFPMLQGRYRGEGELITAIINRVIKDIPDFCPLPITELFIWLANNTPE